MTDTNFYRPTIPMGSLSLSKLARLISLDDPAAMRADVVGAKAAHLSRAHRARLPTLPGFVAPIEEGRASLRAGCRALATSGKGAARSAVLAYPIAQELVSEMSGAATILGGTTIVRSSSALESDARWSGAFSSIAEVGVDDVEAAIRSCWGSAFARDPLERIEVCGLDPEALGLGLLMQPEIAPYAGGLARRSDNAVTITGVRGHPGALLAGLVDGRSATIAEGLSDINPLRTVLGDRQVRRVAELSRATYDILGHDLVEWAVVDGQVLLLQSSRMSGPACHYEPTPVDIGPEAVRVRGVSSVEGDAVGVLHFVGPSFTQTPTHDHILVTERPLAALAPLLFGARGMVCLSGPIDSHLAGVARAIGVPMLVQVDVEQVTGRISSQMNSSSGWMAAIHGRRSELTLVRAETGGPFDRRTAIYAFADR